MSGLHQAWQSLSVEADFQLITADQVRELSGREPRLMMKFDHSYLLPPALKAGGKFILPLKNGLYAILKGEGYHRPEACAATIDFPRQTSFDLGTSVAGISEMQHLDLAFNTGLLSEFLAEPVLYPTIRGRKRSPHFAFRVGAHDLEVDGVQVEIDGGYEGRHCVVVVEAKIGECDDFHLRQLYYPYRFWRERSNKHVRPVFFTYEPSTALYRFREYAFEPDEVYQSPRLVKAAAYRLVDPLPDRPTAPPRRTTPIPQADRLSRIAEIPVLVALGYGEPRKLAQRLEFDPRQGRYYLDAACSLGLLDRAYALTPLGREYVEADPALREGILARAVLGVPLVQELLVSLLLDPDGALSKEDLVGIMQRSTTLSSSTARRRVQTLWSWLSWVSEHGGRLVVRGDEIALLAGSGREASLGTPPNSQLGLF